MTAPRDERPLADVLDEIHLRDIADEFDAMSPEERAREFEKVGGFDAEAARKRIDAARAAAEREAAGGTSSEGKVADLASRRAAKHAEHATRWAPFLAAAAVLLVISGAGTWKASTHMPPRTVDYPATVQGPPRQAIARAVAERALRRCKEGYFEECKDDLELARKLDPASEHAPDYVAAQKALDDEGKRDKTPDPGAFPNAKHGPAPGERPLQPLR